MSSRSWSGVLAVLVLGVVVLAAPRAARAECHCVAIAADVGAAGKLKAEIGDNLYAGGMYAEALAAYAEGWKLSKDAPFLYAQGMCQWRLGRGVEAKAFLEQYLAAGGKAGLKYSGLAQAALADVSAGMPGVGGTIVGGAKAGGRAVGSLTGGVVGGVGGAVGGVDGTVDDVGGVAVGGVGAGLGAGANLAADVTAKPKKVAKGAAIVLGVLAVGAIAAVGIEGIAAGVKDDIDFDYKFGIGMGAAGVGVGLTAIYLYGLTATTGAVSGVGGVQCAQSKKPVLAPMVFAHGGGMAAAFSF
jgi:hypothetical protein